MEYLNAITAVRSRLKSIAMAPTEKVFNDEVWLLGEEVQKALKLLREAIPNPIDQLRDELESLIVTINGDVVMQHNRASIDEYIAQLQKLIVVAFDRTSSLGSGSTEELEEALESNRTVFIVHGHDNEMLYNAKSFVLEVGLRPVILREQLDASMAVIEKFEKHSNVTYAIILLSPDDVGCLAGKTECLRPRARQNVILELGYFMGKLGRERVVAVYRGGDDFELPSDFNGVLYKRYDPQNIWFDVAREMKHCGIDIDLNKL